MLLTPEKCAAYRPSPEASPAMTSHFVIEGTTGVMAKPFNFSMFDSQNCNSSLAGLLSDVTAAQRSSEK